MKQTIEQGTLLNTLPLILLHVHLSSTETSLGRVSPPVPAHPRLKDTGQFFILIILL